MLFIIQHSPALPLSCSSIVCLTDNGPFSSFQRSFLVLSKALPHPFKGPFLSFQMSFLILLKALSCLIKGPFSFFKGPFLSFQRLFLILRKALSCPLKGPFSSFQRRLLSTLSISPPGHRWCGVLSSVPTESQISVNIAESDEKNMIRTLNFLSALLMSSL